MNRLSRIFSGKRIAREDFPGLLWKPGLHALVVECGYICRNYQTACAKDYFWLNLGLCVRWDVMPGFFLPGSVGWKWKGALDRGPPG